jgi:hypothetical protein
MKFHFFIFSIICSFFVSQTVFAQEDKRDDYLKHQTDSILGPPIELDVVYINKNQQKLDEAAKKRFLILQRRVYKVYPYAKTGAERLVMLQKGMGALNSNREKRRYFKIVENYLNNEFEQQLKNLSRKDGQILVKLICRQTGKSTFDLIKDLKSGWKAFWSNNAASLFDINLKTKYDPLAVNEDYLIETILVRAFKNARLQEQAPAFPIDYDEVEDYWVQKIAELKKKS